MKRLNTLAAGVIAVNLCALALLPATRDIFRFHRAALSGERPLGRLLLEMGVSPKDLAPLPPSRAVELPASSSPEFDVRLASATRLNSAEKWAALQRLAADFPDEPAVHAALARFACKNGGSVGIGRNDEIRKILPEEQTIHLRPGTEGTAADIATLLGAAAAGERLDPQNAYFPAMAAIGLYAFRRDAEAHAALHRAAQKPAWNEYLAIEARGTVRRAAALHGPQSSLTRTAHLAVLLLPHYSQLRALARLTVAQALDAELAGDAAAGYALRRDVWALGATMRAQASTAIGNLVGIAITRTATLRPGGSPRARGAEGDASDPAFALYVAAHGAPGDAAAWTQEAQATDDVREIVRKGQSVSAFGQATLFETAARLLSGLVIGQALTLLCLLAGLAFLRPLIGRYAGGAGSALAMGAFLVALAWSLWCAWGNARDVFAVGGLLMGLQEYDNGNQGATEFARMLATLRVQSAIALPAALTASLYPAVVALLTRRRRVPHHILLQRWTLPIAALLTLLYAGQVVTFAVRERVVHAELDQMVRHEGRYLAGKLGKAWPE